MTSVLKTNSAPVFFRPTGKTPQQIVGINNARRRRKQRLNSVYICSSFLMSSTLNYCNPPTPVFKPLMIQPLYFFGFNIISRDNSIYPIFVIDIEFLAKFISRALPPTQNFALNEFSG